MMGSSTLQIVFDYFNFKNLRKKSWKYLWTFYKGWSKDVGEPNKIPNFQ